MKTMKFLLMALLMWGASSEMKAQEVFNIVLKKAESVVNNPHASAFDLKVSHFKETALRYYRNTGINLKKGLKESEMDIQAYSLNQFLTNYFKEIQAAKTEKDRKAAIMKYVQATRNHPMYKDQDTSVTESFVKDEGGYTPFSINVDWEAALAETEQTK